MFSVCMYVLAVLIAGCTCSLPVCTPACVLCVVRSDLVVCCAWACVLGVRGVAVCVVHGLLSGFVVLFDFVFFVDRFHLSMLHFDSEYLARLELLTLRDILLAVPR